MNHLSSRRLRNRKLTSQEKSNQAGILCHEVLNGNMEDTNSNMNEQTRIMSLSPAIVNYTHHGNE